MSSPSNKVANAFTPLVCAHKPLKLARMVNEEGEEEFHLIIHANVVSDKMMLKKVLKLVTNWTTQCSTVWPLNVRTLIVASQNLKEISFPFLTCWSFSCRS